MSSASATATSTLRDPGPAEFVAVLGIGFMMGSSFLGLKLALAGFGPWTVTAMRLTIATAAIGLFLLIKRSPIRLYDVRTMTLLAVISQFNTAIPYFLTAWAVQRLETGVVAILLSTGPIIALVLSHFFTTDDRFGFYKLLSVLLGFAGVCLALDLVHRPLSQIHLWSAVAAIGSATCYSIGGVLTRKVEHLSPDAIAFFVLLFGTVSTIPISVALERYPDTWPAWTTIAGAVYVGLIPTAAAYLLRFRLIAVAGYTFASYSGYLVPLFALVLGAAVLGESITWPVLAGLALALLGGWLRRFA